MRTWEEKLMCYTQRTQSNMAANNGFTGIGQMKNEMQMYIS